MFVWNVSPILVKIGPIQLRYYGLIFAAMMVGGYYLWRWQMLRGGHTEEQAERFFLLGVIGVVGGARLGQVLFYEPGYYLSHPIEILFIWRGGLASHGATIGLVLVLVYFAKRERLPVLEVLDRFSMSAALGALSVRIGNFFNSEIVGRVTEVPWAVKFPRCVYDRGLPLEQVPWRHPSQLYEFFLGLLVFLALYQVDRRLKEERPLGLLASLFFLLYFSGRFFVEFFKEYQTLSPSQSPLTMGQYLSIPFILLGAAGVFYSLKRGVPTSSLRRAASGDKGKGRGRTAAKGKGRKKR